MKRFNISTDAKRALGLAIIGSITGALAHFLKEGNQYAIEQLQPGAEKRSIPQHINAFVHGVDVRELTSQFLAGGSVGLRK